MVRRFTRGVENMRTDLEVFVSEIAQLVKKEYSLDIVENDGYHNDVVSTTDSFGDITLVGYCEPEDAIWHRDLQDNFFYGLKVGIRNTVKVLTENPSLLKEYLDEN